MAIHCSGTILPFELSFVYMYGQEENIKYVWKSSQKIEQDRLIVLNEDWPTAIRFNSDTIQDWDEEASVVIQTSLFDQNDTQRRLSFPMCENDQWIFRDKGGGATSTYPWRMGTYFIEITYKGEQYLTGFIIKPNHLSKEQVLFVHQYLEGKVEGIIYDIIYSHQAYSESLHEQLTNKWYYDYARYISEMKNNIIHAFQLLIQRPVVSIKSEYLKTIAPGRLDSRVMRLNQLKPSVENFVKVKREDINTKENQWIKNILLSWNQDISSVYSQIRFHYDQLKEEQIKIQEEIDLKSERKRDLESKRDVSKKDIIDLSSRIKFFQSKLKAKKDFINQHNQWMNDLFSIQSQIQFILNKSYFCEVSRGFRRPVLKNPAYYRIDAIFNETRKVKKEGGNRKRYIKILKPTWQIYEYYTLFETINILQEMNYRLVNGFNSDWLEYYYENKIPEGIRFELENEIHVIHIWYDKYLAHTEKEAQEKGETFFINDPKKRPDLKLDAYIKDHEGDLQYKDSLVMDAKFRKLSNITNRSYNSEAFDQLVTYNNIFYTGNNRLYRNHFGTSVHRVVCLYASDGKEDVITIQYPITFIKLFPKIEGDSSIQVIGRDELQQVIIGWLEERR